MGWFPNAKKSRIDFPSQITTVRGGPLWTACFLLKWNKGAEEEKIIVDLRFLTSWTMTCENCTRAHVQQNKSVYLSVYFSVWKRYKRLYIYIYIYITDDEQINCRFDLAFYYYLVSYYTTNVFSTHQIKLPNANLHLYTDLKYTCDRLEIW